MCLTRALSAATQKLTRTSPKSASGRSTGRQGAAEIRVYDSPSWNPTRPILARQATAVVWPQPTPTEQPAGAGATAQAAHGTPHESHPPAAAAALGEPAEPADLDRLGDQIAELSARIDAATYELLGYLREFDRQHGWEGFRSCAHWLNWRTGLDLGAAREKLRVAAALAELPHISAAMACGRLSYSKVRALSRVAAPATEARLLAVACGATAAQVERLVRGWRQADRDAQADGEQRYAWQAAC